MNIIPTELPEVLIIEPKIFKDERGYFFETYHAERYREAGIIMPDGQDNFSYSGKNVLRGLHFQSQHPQAKLVWVTRGAVLDVVVDIRSGSPNFGKSVAVILDAQQHRQMYIPEGFAHGFCVLSDEANFYYKCSDFYHPAAEQGIVWNDPDLNIAWPKEAFILAAKDKQLPRLRDLSPEVLPVYA